MWSRSPTTFHPPLHPHKDKNLFSVSGRHGGGTRGGDKERSDHWCAHRSFLRASLNLPPAPWVHAEAGKGCTAVPHAVLIGQGTSDGCHNHTAGHMT